MNFIKMLGDEFSGFRYKGEKKDRERPPLTTKEVRNISKKYFKEVKDLEKNNVFDICEKFLDLEKWEYSTVGFDWAYRKGNYFERKDFKRFTLWMEKYVKDWNACDDFCTHAFGYFLYKYPEFYEKTLHWTGSDNMWFRRASSVILIYSIRREKLIHEGYKTADKLLIENEDLVQKGCGWMLKEISNKCQNSVFDYVLKNKEIMKRTILRYAIEKMPPEKRKILMERK